MSLAIQQTREHYRPDGVRILFIGESPPLGGTFFYNENSDLHYATREASVAGGFPLSDSDFLRAFQRAGCYPEDLAGAPVDGLARRPRKDACKAGISPLAARISLLAPQAVVIIGYGIAEQVVGSLELAGHAEVERHELPFPTTRPRASDGVPYRQAYISELAALVSDGTSAPS